MTSAPVQTAGAVFASIPAALDQLRAGRMLVVVDDADRENEGDLTLAAEHITPAAINFMARHGRGLICAALSEERLDALRIPLMTADNTSNFGTAFCESVDARAGVTTGISAADRARSIQVLVDPAARPEDLARPGHIFPLRARRGGVLARAGQTEAAVDLARLAGLQPAGVICEIMNEDGSMARVPELSRFCQEHGLLMVTVADLIRYRRQHERHVQRLGERTLTTRHGRCRLIAYRDDLDQATHSALIFGELSEPVLARVQNHCLAGAWGARECACAANLEAALARIAAAGSGVVVILHQNSSGFALEPGSGALLHPSQPSESQVQRETGIGAQILTDLGIRQLQLLTDHPRRLAALDGYGLEIVGHVPLAGMAR